VSEATAEQSGRRDAPAPPQPGPLADLVGRAYWFTPPLAPRLDPTPANGPDPYGNPDPEWLRIDWTERLRTITVKSGGSPTRVNYVEMGPLEDERGEEIVMVHGLAGCWQNWLENIPELARHRRVVALDLPGFGASPLPEWEISIESHGLLVRDFCDALELGQCALVGNSMGGFVAAEAVVRDQERFSRLALVSAAGISHARRMSGPASTAARMSALVTPYALGLREGALRRPRLRFLILSGLFYNPLKLRSELIYEFTENGPGTDGFLPAVRGMHGYDFLDSLEEVELPVLIVWGRNDRVVPPLDAYGYGQRLRNSRTVIYDRTGHVAMAERPVRFNRELQEFLAG
jgi:pimeloyl-ACP methyl ester carboxylesterase